MKKTIPTSLAVAIPVALLGFSQLQSNGASVAIDFAVYSTGTALSQLNGITFSLLGGPDSTGAPQIARSSLTNSSNAGAYPTANILQFEFDLLANDIVFRFDNQGSGTPGGRGDSYFQAFADNGSLLETGSLNGLSGGLVTLVADGVKTLQFNNRTGGANNWVFDVNSITYTTVPETSTTLLGALAGAGLLIRRRRG